VLERCAVLQPAPVVQLHLAALDLEDDDAAIGRREHEVRLADLAARGAKPHRVPGHPARR